MLLNMEIGMKMEMTTDRQTSRCNTIWVLLCFLLYIREMTMENHRHLVFTHNFWNRAHIQITVISATG